MDNNSNKNGRFEKKMIPTFKGQQYHVHGRQSYSMSLKCVSMQWFLISTSVDYTNGKRNTITYLKLDAPNPKLNWFSSRLAIVFAQSNKARCQVEIEDVVGAAPTGDAPTTSEWSTILLPTNVRLILETWRYVFVVNNTARNASLST